MVKRVLKRQRPTLPGLPETVEPQPRLEPIIGNLYGTPPVDPTDCSLFPDSPSCGGMPFSKRPIDASVDLVLDSCNIGIQLNAVVAFIKMPSVQIVYRKDECRLGNLPDNLSSNLIPFDFDIFPENGSVRFTLFRYALYQISDTGAETFIDYTTEGMPKKSEPGNQTEERFIQSWQEWETTFRKGFPISIDGQIGRGVYLDGQLEIYQDAVFSEGLKWEQYYISGTVYGTNKQNLDRALSLLDNKIHAYEMKVYTRERLGIPDDGLIPPPFNDMGCNCCPKIKENDALLRLILKRIGTPTTVEIFDEDLERKGSQRGKKTPPTLFEANKLNTQRTEIVNRIIGIANFPIEVPETVIEASREGLDKFIYDFFTNKTRKINTIAEFIYWMAEQDSAVLGQFHQQIEFESANEQSGKLEKDLVTIPNVAEALKEIILLLVQMANNDALENVGTVKILAELSNIKVNLFKTMQTVIDMQDYMDYPTNTKEVNVDLPVNFELTKDGLDFEDFYSQSKGSFTYEDWTGENSLHDNMLDLLQLATIMRALFYDRGTG